MVDEALGATQAVADLLAADEALYATLGAALRAAPRGRS
jgi:hypothetical protein